MKLLFIPAKSNADIKPVIEKLLNAYNSKLGQSNLRLGLATTAQHEHKLKKAKEILERNGHKAVIAGMGGIITGCDVRNAERIKNKIDLFLFLGTGRFHPLYLAYKTKKRVIIANPITSEIGEIKESEIKEFEGKRKGAVLKFLNAERIGIIVSTKKGQFNLTQANILKEKLQRDGKEAFIFICDNFNSRETQNFPDIQAWVNTACPRLCEDFCMVNIDEILEQQVAGSM